MKLSRRSLLVGSAAAVGAFGCEADEMESGIPPWHMWGNSIQLSLISGGASTTPPQPTGQLVRIAYRRPETWTFLLGVRAISARGAGGAPVSPGNVFVDFLLTTGIGRSQVVIASGVAGSGTPFQRFRFQWGGANFPNNLLKFSTTVTGPVIDDQAVAPPQNLISWIPAQDIQLECSGVMITPTTGDTCVMQVEAYFAPRSHVRPEWFRRPPRFPGAEG